MGGTLLYQRGTVVGFDGDFTCIVEFEPIAGCKACAGGQGCGIAPLAGFISGHRRNRLAIDICGQSAVAIDDTVRVGIDARRFMLLLVMTYATPLLGLIVGTVTMVSLAPGAGDVGALSGGVVGGLLAIGLLLATTGRRRSMAWLGARVMKLS